MDEPKQQRIDELTELVRTGRATDAEVEELRLYDQDDNEERALVVTATRDRELGGNWLARSAADQRLEAAEKTPLTVAERRIGVGMTVAGFVGALFVPAAGLVAAAGLGLLAFSVVRVKIKTAGKDPYSKIEK